MRNDAAMNAYSRRVKDSVNNLYTNQKGMTLSERRNGLLLPTLQKYKT